MNPQRNPHPSRTPAALAALAIALSGTLLSAALLPAAASAQQPAKSKKLYCWNEGGRRVCSDTLPASAVGHQRTERDQKTGTALSQIAREMTAEERAAAAAQAKALESEADRKRHEMAMVVSYTTEKDLQRAFQERFALVDESLKSSSMAHTNLRKSLISLLRQANELELQSKPVKKTLRDRIQTQHNELRMLRDMQQRQQAERATLQAEYQQALTRYRELKGATASAPAGATGG